MLALTPFIILMTILLLYVASEITDSSIAGDATSIACLIPLLHNLSPLSILLLLVIPSKGTGVTASHVFLIVVGLSDAPETIPLVLDAPVAALLVSDAPETVPLVPGVPMIIITISSIQFDEVSILFQRWKK